MSDNGNAAPRKNEENNPVTILVYSFFVSGGERSPRTGTNPLDHLPIVRDYLTARLGDLTNLLTVSSGWSPGTLPTGHVSGLPNLDWFKGSFLDIFVAYTEDSIMADVSTQAMTVRTYQGA